MSDSGSPRVVALDVGDARIGVALSDPTRLLATPFTVIHRKEGSAAGRIAQLVQDQHAGTVLVGLPRNMDGSIGPQARKVQAFADQIRELLPKMEFVFWDERRTTMEARAQQIAAGAKKKKRAEAIDAQAAAILLQNYLDYLRRQANRPENG